MKKMKNILALVALIAMFSMVMVACNTDTNTTEATTTEATEAGSEEAGSEEAGTGLTGPISVVSREDGSGTRSAFVEIVDVMQDKNDMTVQTAIIQNGTDAVMTTVGNTPDAIGYISLGSLNDTVKAVKIEGVEATDQNIIDGKYPIARPFNIATKGEPSELAQYFIDFIMSKEGQEIAGDGYIAVDSGAAAFEAKDGLTGNIQVGGSTSVAPMVEKMAEKFTELTGVTVDIQASGSSAGMTGAIDGVLDIGMASRELSDEEKAELTPIVIAQDGIAVIVNNENPMEDLTLEQVQKIYLGELLNWEDIK